jgi:hypothetical protein
MNQTRINLADYLATIEGDIFARHADKEKVLDLFLKKYKLTPEQYHQLPGKNFTIHPTKEGPKSAPHTFFLKKFYPNSNNLEEILEEKIIHLYKIGLGTELICTYLGINAIKCSRILKKNADKIQRRPQKELKEIRETFLDTIWGEA